MSDAVLSIPSPWAQTCMERENKVLNVKGRFHTVKQGERPYLLTNPEDLPQSDFQEKDNV